jgi:hypothetical protein
MIVVDMFASNSYVGRRTLLDAIYLLLFFGSV